MKYVVIIAPRDDLHAEIVAARIAREGGVALILPLDELLTTWSVACLIDDGIVYRIATADRVIEGGEISGLWWRRPRSAPISSGSAVDQFRRRETGALIDGLLHHLDSRVINPIAAERIARNKLKQLEAAVAEDFRIPRTLVTTGMPEAAQFRASNEAGTVFKLLTYAPGRKLIETRSFTEENEAHSASLALAPVLFQERICKAVEVRATIVDDECFAIQCVTEAPCLDWRVDQTLRYEPYDLDLSLRHRLLRLHRRLGLRYGAADLAITADGEAVFFETNVSGQFLFCEIDAGEPISVALAKALLAEQRPCTAPETRLTVTSEQPCASGIRASCGS